MALFTGGRSYPRGKENSMKKRLTDEQIIRILREAESRESR